MPERVRINLQSRRAQRGLTAVEYAVAGSMITILVVAAFTNLGERLLQAFQFIADAM